MDVYGKEFLQDISFVLGGVFFVVGSLVVGVYGVIGEVQFMVIVGIIVVFCCLEDVVCF